MRNMVLVGCALWALAGCDDGSIPADAGRRTDAGRDAAVEPMDAGPIDAGPTDAGPADAGPIDAGPTDAGPTDAGPTDAGDSAVADGGSDGGSLDGGTDAGPVDPLCPGRIGVLGCGDTVSGNTGDGSDAVSGYPCLGSSYPGPEVVYRFTSPTAREVTLRVTRSTSSGPDLDLVVTAGDGPCDGTAACLASSQNIAPWEEVTFSAEAGAPYWVYYDLVASSDPATVDYMVEVTCADPE